MNGTDPMGYGRHWFYGSVFAAVLAASPGQALAQQGPESSFSAQAGSLRDALNQVSRTYSVNIMAPDELIDGQTSPAVSGTFDAVSALGAVLKGTGLTYRQTQGGALVLARSEGVQQTSRNAPARTQVRPGPSSKIEEVYVTATRRPLALSRAPLSISVLDDSEILRRNISGFSDYLATVPGVSFFDLGTGNNSIIMRGLAARPQFDSNASGPLVGVYFGEVPMAGLALNGQQPDVKLIDLERVEVLRGPQGTLYGSSNMGGTVRNIPAAVKLDTFEARVQGGVSETAERGGTNYESQAMVNVPIIDGKLGLRANVYYSDRSGFYENIGTADPLVAQAVDGYGANAFTGDNQGAEQFDGIRLALRWQPIEQLDATLLYLDQSIEQNGSPSADRTLGENAYLQGRLLTRNTTDLAATGVLPGDPRVSEPVFRPLATSDIELWNLQLEWASPFGTFLSSTSSVDQVTRTRGAAALLPGDLDPSNPFAEGPVGRANGTDADAFFQEFRFTSSWSGPLGVVAGLFYEDVERGRDPWNAFIGTDLSKNPYGTPEEPIVTFVSELELEFTQRAVYGEVTYQILDNLSATAGGRYFDYDYGTVSEFISDPFFATLPPPTVLDGGDDGSLFKASLDYSPTAGSLLYATWSEGYRLGQVTGGNTPPRCDQDGDGFFDEIPGLSTGVRTLDPDTTDNFELGAKLNFYDDRLQLNAALFRIDWEGIPLVTFSENFCGGLVNAGDARSEGLEVEAVLAVTDKLRVTVGGSWVSAPKFHT